MYGKFFASTFTGSLFGAGSDVFAVWGYVIANTVNSGIELNPALLAAVLGTTTEAVQRAIDVLCADDPGSRSPEEHGRRLIHEGAFQYRVVNHAKYRAMRSEEDRRAYNRDAKRRERAVKRDVIDNHGMSRMSAHTEAEADTEADTRESKERSLSARATRGPLIESPLAWDRKHGGHLPGFCDWVCLPSDLAEQFAARAGWPVSAVAGWAQRVRDEWQAAGRVPAERAYDFWAYRWQEAHPPSKPAATRGPNLLAEVDAAIAAREGRK